MTQLIGSVFQFQSPSIITLCFAHYRYGDNGPIVSLGISRLVSKWSGDGGVCAWEVSWGRVLEAQKKITELFSKQNNTVLLWPMGQICLSPPIFVNKILWEHNHILYILSMTPLFLQW